jgi:glutamate-ammonia-ligase adenylyltransferase
MENYYAGYGETWERMALIKARGIAGDPELLYEFEHRLQPFIYPRSVSSDLVEEIAEIKQRIERDLLAPEELHRNVKLGYGGIREVEFTVQALQLLHGARNPFLQERNTLETLTALVELGILPRDDASALSSAYVFLRAVEHRLQIPNEQQTHTLPALAEQRFLTARSVWCDSVSAFDVALADQTRTVRGIFDRLLQTDRTKPVGELDFSAFTDPEQARKTLDRLREGPPNVHVAPRTRRLYAKLEPMLLTKLGTAAEPDSVLSRFVRFVDNYGIRGLLFETLLANPRLLQLLIKLFDASEVFSEIVLQRPELIEELARGRLLGKQETIADFIQRLDQEQPDLTPAEWLRRFRRAEGVRILLRDALGFADLEQLQAEMTDLAEACLGYCCRFVSEAEELTLLAQGKFGGRELLYGADLDLVFIGHNKVAAGRLIQAMGAKTEAGRVFPIDSRLRPEGENGPLVVSLETYRNYFQNRAQSWERQALTKARVVGGPVANDLALVVDEIWNRFREYPAAFSDIAHMYRRVVRERGTEHEFLQFKTGRGGIMAIEFLVQAIGLRTGPREPNTSRAIQRFAACLEAAEADSLRASYLYLRRVESVLRRVSNSSISQLPSADLDQLRLARRLGYQSREAFAEEYWDHRMRAESTVSKYLG